MTAELPRLWTAAEVADALGVTERFVRDQCRGGDWPYWRGPRGTVKFTDEHYAAILALRAVTPAERPAPRISFAPRSRRAS